MLRSTPTLLALLTVAAAAPAAHADPQSFTYKLTAYPVGAGS